MPALSASSTRDASSSISANLQSRARSHLQLSVHETDHDHDHVISVVKEAERLTHQRHASNDLSTMYPQQRKATIKDSERLNEQSSTIASSINQATRLRAETSAWAPVVVPARESPYKFLFVGSKLVGKTSIVHRLTSFTSRFQENEAPSTQIDIQQRFIEIGEGRSLISIELWDVPELNHLRYEPFYLKDVDGAFVCADCCEPNSFAVLQSWCNKLSHVPVILLANKADAPNSRVAPRMIDESAKFFKLFRGIRCSAKDGTNVHEALMTMLREVQRRELHLSDALEHSAFPSQANTPHHRVSWLKSPHEDSIHQAQHSGSLQSTPTAVKHPSGSLTTKQQG